MQRVVFSSVHGRTFAILFSFVPDTLALALSPNRLGFDPDFAQTAESLEKRFGVNSERECDQYSGDWPA